MFRGPKNFLFKKCWLNIGKCCPNFYRCCINWQVLPQHCHLQGVKHFSKSLALANLWVVGGHCDFQNCIYVCNIDAVSTYDLLSQHMRMLLKTYLKTSKTKKEWEINIIRSLTLPQHWPMFPQLLTMLIKHFYVAETFWYVLKNLFNVALKSVNAAATLLNSINKSRIIGPQNVYT